MSRFEEIHIEKDFWDDFIVEAFEHIDAIESNAMDLEQNPENTEIIHTMFRAFHTIKGLSGFVEHTIVQEVAHKTETMMDLCRKGELKVNTDIVNAILKSSDYIKQLCDNIEAYKDENLINIIENHIDILEVLANIDTKPAAEPQPAPESISTDEPISQEPVLQKTEEGLQAFADEMFEGKEEEPKPEQQETVGKNEVKEETTESQAVPENFQTEEVEISFEQSETPEEIPNTEAKVQENQPELKEEQAPILEQEVFEFKTEPDVEQTEQPVKQLQEDVPLSVEQQALKDFQKQTMEKLRSTATAVKEEAQKENPMAKHVSANEEYMKVANYKIDHLVDTMGELIINQALIEQYVLENYPNDRQLITNMSGFLRIIRELQNLSMSLRMVSLKSTFQKLTRIARDTIQELNKEVEFISTGENIEIDRVVAEKLLDPLVHMIKNAISHGVEERPEDRVNIGKTRKAKVELNAYSKRGKIFIEVRDDGRGINTEIVYQKALEKGLVDPAKTYSEAEIKEFIMLPGFSTAKVVDNISGRGVGMDVVKTQILKIGGKVEIQSELNKGSTFILEVPVNHAIMNGTIIEMNSQQFVVPTVNVKEFLQPTKDQWISTKQERTMIKVRDNIIPIVPLSVFFKETKTNEEEVPLVMLLELDQELRAVPITNVINRQEVVVKPVGEEFSNLKYISGMSILGNGKVSLILDIDYLFRKEIKE